MVSTSSIETLLRENKELKAKIAILEAQPIHGNLKHNIATEEVTKVSPCYSPARCEATVCSCDCLL